jgi:hypothetical protein
MERVRFIAFRGKQILHLDFAHARPDEALKIIDAAKNVIAAQPELSVRTLTDVTDMKSDAAVSEAMKEFANHTKPYVTAAAVIGVKGLKQIIYNAVVKFSGRNLVAFDSGIQAKEWLSRQ